MLLVAQLFALLAVVLWGVRAFRQAVSWKRGGAPWVPSRVTAVGPVLTSLIPKGAQVVEAGAGDGRVAGYLAKQGYEVTAIELDRLLVAWGQVRFPQVSWIHGDLRQAVFPVGAYVYAYLTPELLAALWKRLPKGSVLLALTFAVPGATAAQEVPVPGWQGVLRVYRR